MSFDAEKRAGGAAFWDGRELDECPYVNIAQREAWRLGWELAEADDIADAEGWPRGDTPVPGH